MKGKWTITGRIIEGESSTVLDLTGPIGIIVTATAGGTGVGVGVDHTTIGGITTEGIPDPTLGVIQQGIIISTLITILLITTTIGPATLLIIRTDTITITKEEIDILLYIIFTILLSINHY